MCRGLSVCRGDVGHPHIPAREVGWQGAARGGVGWRLQVLGSINGSGRITLVDPAAPAGQPTPVDLDLEKVLGKMPNKTFAFQRQPDAPGKALVLPEVPPPALRGRTGRNDTYAGLASAERSHV